MGLLRHKAFWLACLTGFCGCLFSVSCPAPALPPTQRVAKLYQSNLNRLDSTLVELGRQVTSHRPARAVQAAFRRARLAYKHIEPLTAYYFLQSARNLNGPNVPEGEVDDGQAFILQPEGFQVIEPLLFPVDTSRRTEVSQQLLAMRQTVSQLRRLATTNPLSDAFIIDALRQEVFRIETLGITGFDSPVARYSLPESAAALHAIRETLVCYPLRAANPRLASRIAQTISTAQHQLQQASSFNRFDRLRFIRTCAHPLSGLLLDAQLALKLPTLNEKRLLRTSARTLSDLSAFDPDYFATHSDPPSTPARIALGKRLFNNPVLSAEGSGRSCASCHQPDRAFQDGLPTAPPLVSRRKAGAGALRNTPTLWNAGLQASQFMDMRVFTLEQQLTDVIHNAHEMGGSMAQAVARLNQQADYRTQFADQYTTGLTPYTVRHALATYIRSLISLNSRTDQYLRGRPVALSASERLGFNLFMGKAKCATCHYFPLYNGTVPPAYHRSESEVIGVPDTGRNLTLSPDAGRYTITGIPFHVGSFKTPTLRKISQTAPYMHNGAYTTLTQVVDFYDKGGGAGLGFTVAHQTLPAEKLRLTATEKRALLSFLKTL
ncbi:cytochrome c peroxidase [Fibrella arboris]|uniref:cytochrome c peroxidase n=1 Tax=Fibrella arboris TaxID=3242486 RepID=UPI0035226861